MLVFRRVIVLVSFAVLLVLSPFLQIGASAKTVTPKPCDQRCKQQVTWYLSVQFFKYTEFLAAAIANTPEAQCVANIESHGSYTVQNVHSTASGKYQFLDTTWSSVAYRRHRPDLAHMRAKDAPWWEQEFAFWWAWVTEGGSPWGPDGCG